MKTVFMDYLRLHMKCMSCGGAIPDALDGELKVMCPVCMEKLNNALGDFERQLKAKSFA